MCIALVSTSHGDEISLVVSALKYLRIELLQIREGEHVVEPLDLSVFLLQSRLNNNTTRGEGTKSGKTDDMDVIALDEFALERNYNYNSEDPLARVFQHRLGSNGDKECICLKELEIPEGLLRQHWVALRDFQQRGGMITVIK